MRNLLALLAGTVLVLGGVGFYQGWCSVATAPAEPGRLAFRFEVDLRKVGQDLVAGVKKLQPKAEEVKKGAEGSAGE